MTRQELYHQIIRAKQPHELFGDIPDADAIEKEYRRLVVLIHPDTAPDALKYISNEGLKKLNELYRKAQSELRSGTYAKGISGSAYAGKTAAFTFSLRGTEYRIYEKLCSGDVSEVFGGETDSGPVILKVARDSADNGLLKEEYQLLCGITHPQIPVVRDFVTIDDCSAIIMDEIPGETLRSVQKRYPGGVPEVHIMWMMERLLSVAGYLHFNRVVHGNITPDNVILTKENHKLSLVGFSFSIPEAASPDAEYRIWDPIFSAPEVGKGARVTPASDIYSIGMLIIWLMGGNASNHMSPVNVSSEVNRFLRRMTLPGPRPMDAWKLWDEWRELRRRIYGDRHFLTFD